MKKINVDVDELVEALNSGDVATENLLMNTIADSFNDEEIVEFIKKLSGISHIRRLFHILRQRGRLENIIKHVWNHKSIIKQFDELFYLFPNEFKDYVMKIFEISPKINIRFIISVSIASKVKIDNLDTYPNFKNIVFELGAKDSFEYYYYVLMAHKLYGILSDSELKETLNNLKERLMRVRSPNHFFLKHCVELYIEFAKIDDFKIMKKLMSFIEKKNED